MIRLLSKTQRHDLSRIVRAELRARRLRQVEIGRAIGASPHAMSLAVNGHSNASGTLIKIAVYLGIPRPAQS